MSPLRALFFCFGVANAKNYIKIKKKNYIKILGLLQIMKNFSWLFSSFASIFLF
jgi:hypothetical protein